MPYNCQVHVSIKIASAISHYSRTLMSDSMISDISDWVILDISDRTMNISDKYFDPNTVVQNNLCNLVNIEFQMNSTVTMHPKYSGSTSENTLPVTTVVFRDDLPRTPRLAAVSGRVSLLFRSPPNPNPTTSVHLKRKICIFPQL